LSGYFASFSQRSGPLAGSTSVRPAKVVGLAESAPEHAADSRAIPVRASIESRDVPPAPARRAPEPLVELPHEEAPVERPAFIETSREHSKRVEPTPPPTRTEDLPERIANPQPAQLTLRPASAPAANAPAASPPAGRALKTPPPPSLPVDVRTGVHYVRSSSLGEPDRAAPPSAPSPLARDSTTEPPGVHEAPPVQDRLAGPPVLFLTTARPVIESARVHENAKSDEPRRAPVEVRIGSISIEVSAPRREPERRPVVQIPRAPRNRPGESSSSINLSRLYWRGW